MLSSFFIAFREGLEAFLIIGIIISYLVKIGEKKYVKHVVYGAVLAIALSSFPETETAFEASWT